MRMHCLSVFDVTKGRRKFGALYFELFSTQKKLTQDCRSPLQKFLFVLYCDLSAFPFFYFKLVLCECFL